MNPELDAVIDAAMTLSERLIDTEDAMKDLLQQLAVLTDAPPAIVGQNARFVHPDGDDAANDGKSRDRPFKSIERALKANTDELILLDGTWRPPFIVNRPVTIKAERKWGAVISNTMIFRDGVSAGPEGKIFAIESDAEPWAGYAGGEFIPRYLDYGDLRQAETGFYTNGKRLFVKLPDGVSEGEFTETYADNLIIVESEGVSLGGLQLRGAGNGAAVICPHQIELLACMSGLSRHLAKVGSDSALDHCRYLYEGFDVWAKRLIATKGQQALYDYVKEYNADGGNAQYEGGIAIGWGGTADVTTFRCHCGPAWDGARLGEFDGGTSAEDVFVDCFDDAIECESWRREDRASALVVDRPLIINSWASSISHQDVSGGMEGPHKVDRATILLREARPAFHIKNLTRRRAHNPLIQYDRCFFDVCSGGETWGRKTWLYLHHDLGRNVRLRITNSVIIADRIDGGPDDLDVQCDWNIVVADKPYPHIQGPNGMFLPSVDDLKIGEWIDVVPREGSPLIGAGENGVTVGPFDFGEVIPEHWQGL